VGLVARAGQVVLPREAGASMEAGGREEAGRQPEDAQAEPGAPAPLDFSRLKRQYAATTNDRDRAALDEEFKADIAARAAALEKVAPNLKAGDARPGPLLPARRWIVE
jgi:hypothetical protein